METEVKMRYDAEQASQLSLRQNIGIVDICRFLQLMMTKLSEKKDKRQLAEAMIGAAKTLFSLTGDDVNKFCSSQEVAAPSAV